MKWQTFGGIGDLNRKATVLGHTFPFVLEGIGNE